MSHVSLLDSAEEGRAGDDGIAASLTKAPPFDALPSVVLEAVAETAAPRRYHAGETVYSPGHFDGQEFLLVLRGRLKAAFSSPETGAMMIETIGAGEIFGLPEAMAEQDETGNDLLTLTAEEDCEAIAFDAEAFRAIVARRPLLARRLMRYFAAALIAAKRQSAPAELSAERRVFAALMEYVARDPVSGVWRVERMPRHRELGEKAGADEAATANAIARLIQDGIARRDYPGLVIDDIAQLNRLAS